MSYYKPATPVTLRTLGTTQRVLLLKAREGAIRTLRENEKQAALRLHEHGLLDRGRTSRDFWITEKGMDLG